MGNEKADNVGVRSEEAANLVRVASTVELERRVTGLEGAIHKLENSQVERHARLITIIFSCMTLFVAVCAILVTVLGLSSKSESREASRDMQEKIDRATKEMQGRVDAQISQMQKDFAALAGDALKRPRIEISTKAGPLDGQSFGMSTPTGSFPIFPLFITNVGDRRADQLSVRLFASALFTFNSSDWQQIESRDVNYPVSYSLSSGIVGLTINPKDTWVLQQEQNYLNPSTNVIMFKLVVYYGVDRPAEAKFVVRFGK